jgi:UTP--glucose-1-phosphate uridylyltransferase
MNIYEEKLGSVVGVQEIPKDKVSSYGVVDPQEFVKPNLCQVKGFIEKPTPEKAPSNLAITGRYLFTSDIYKHLKKAKPSVGGEIQLTDSISALAVENPVYALKYHGQYYDIGGKLGFVKATIHFALEDETISKDVQTFIDSLQKK